MVLEAIHGVITVLFYLLSTVGVVVVFWGVGEASTRFFRLKLQKDLHHTQTIAETARIRERLGAHLLLGLDIFIAADIIKSVVTPTWENIAMLGGIVVIRIVMSYFLEREMKEAHTVAGYGRRAADRIEEAEERVVKEEPRA